MICVNVLSGVVCLSTISYSDVNVEKQLEIRCRGKSAEEVCRFRRHSKRTFNTQGTVLNR